MLFGRDQECTRVDVLLEAARASQSGALVVVGEPGIGKTALLEDTRARAADMHVLSAQGVQSESELPFAALHQMFWPALADIASIPSRQAEALRGALGIGESSQTERFLVFAACLSLLSEVAERRAVLCLVDDAQWLDAASAEALLFVARRLDAEGIAMLFAVREGEPNGFEAPGVPHLRLGGLDAQAAETLLARSAGVEAASHVRQQLLAHTGGNPLALLEIPSGLTGAQLSGRHPLPAALPLTRQVEDVFLARVRSLTPDAQWLLLIAAADDSETAATIVGAFAQRDEAMVALHDAETADLISVDGPHVKFRHPLVRSAVYSAATSHDRRAAHLKLAAALAGEPEQRDRRAWHLASAALEPDDAVASALEDAAERAQSRAAFGAAASALERAAELSCDNAARARRLIEAARCASIAGTDDKALALVDRTRLLIDDSPARGTRERCRGGRDSPRKPGQRLPVADQRGARDLRARPASCSRALARRRLGGNRSGRSSDARRVSSRRGTR